jgi:hypothetical protein
MHQATPNDDDAEADFIAQRMRELMAADDTKTLAFLWDDEGECWLAAAMWQSDGGCNFTVDASTAAQLTAMFVALYRAATEDD